MAVTSRIVCAHDLPCRVRRACSSRQHCIDGHWTWQSRPASTRRRLTPLLDRRTAAGASSCYEKAITGLSKLRLPDLASTRIRGKLGAFTRRLRCSSDSSCSRFAQSIPVFSEEEEWLAVYMPDAQPGKDEAAAARWANEGGDERAVFRIVDAR
jgi:hypothetical protein